ncbi:MAG: hypothetical protein Ct9H300mP14_16160 [Gammaproteobacteria bacterium]|nr:MAG: hypothetical protein Ct9H300mP14_16160 [Gammaproteobacteria bacterium]
MDIKKRDLRRRLEQGDFICAPVYLILFPPGCRPLFFPLLYDGYGLLLFSGVARCGLPVKRMVERVDRIVLATSTPVIAR